MPPIFRYQDPPVLSFSPKRIGETITFAYDFVNLLNSGEAILSGIWYLIPVRPVNISISTIGMLVGSPNVAGTQIFQQIASGTEGVTYNVVAKVYTTKNNVIEQGALLLTTNNAYET